MTNLEHLQKTFESIGVNYKMTLLRDFLDPEEKHTGWSLDISYTDGAEFSFIFDLNGKFEEVSLFTEW